MHTENLKLNKVELMETDDIKNNVTFLIKSFLRRSCVDNLIVSIRKFYPETLIVVVDDSNPPLSFDQHYNVKTYNIDFNSGISVGRNFGLSKIDTKYFVLLDDDFEFTPRTDIRNFYEVIERHNMDIVGGQLIENGHPVQYFGNFVTDEKTKTVIFELGSENVGEYKKCQIVLNFFIGRTDSIKAHGWDNLMKTIEHSPFFYEHRNVLKTGVVENVSVDHKKINMPEYSFYRKSGWGGFLNWLERKNIKNYVNPANQLTTSSIVVEQDSKMNETLALKNLIDLDKLFKKFNAPYWIQDGTLLGHYREKNFLRHDPDTDMGMMLSDFSTKMLEYLETLKFKYNFLGYPESCLQLELKRFNIKTDIFFYYKKEDFIYHSAFLKNKIIDYRYKKFSLKEETFLGYNFLMPSNELEFIVTKYGENWKVPDKSWSYAYSPKNHYESKMLLDFTGQNEKIKEWLKFPRKIPKKVITYGTFDTFHYGHLELLRRAKQFGSHLTVGLSTDDFNSIKGKKSKFSYSERYEWLKSISCVDEIIPETSWGQKKRDTKNVDVMVMGDDWLGKFDELPCMVIYLKRTPDISSTKIKGN